MVKPPKIPDEALAKLEPKLTILKKRNPLVFEWVLGLSRGKLTQFIYEVLDIYMEQGYLLDDDWVHPTDNKAMLLLQKKPQAETNNNEKIERLEHTIGLLTQQLSSLTMHIQNGGVMMNMTPTMMQNQGYFANPQSNQAHDMTHRAYHHPNQTNNINPINDNQNSYSKNVENSTQNHYPNVSSKGLDAQEVNEKDSFVIILEDEPDNKPKEEKTTDLPSIGQSGGFNAY